MTHEDQAEIKFLKAEAQLQRSASESKATQLRRDRDPEAEAGHTRIHTLVNPLERTRALSESGREQDSDVHEDQERITDLHALYAEGATAGQSSRPRAAREGACCTHANSSQQFMERHDDVAQGVDRRDRQEARSSTADDEYFREASRLENKTEKENEETFQRQGARRQRLRSRTTRCMIEVQNNAMHDRNSELKERTHYG